ncbi:hypothetical protein J4463_02565 [Candidatus Pacearchaeota archaeon]|nr:hypothetical protein [Candidatus Pacearchaeota archaeon]
MKEFDYYVFIDYSDNLIGYIILKKENLRDCLCNISRFRHYRESKKRKLYLKNAKSTFNKKDLLRYFVKTKVRNVIETPEIFTDIAEFLKIVKGSKIFISVDNRQYKNFEKFVKIIDGENIRVIKESDLKEHSPEYRINLVLDTWLNIERMKEK